MKDNESVGLNICMLLTPQPWGNLKGLANPILIELFADNLPALGHSITWILSSTTETEEHSFRKARIYPIASIELSSLPGKILNRVLVAYKTWRIARKLFQKKKYDLIQIEESLLNGLIGAYIKGKFKVPFVFRRDNIIDKDWHLALSSPVSKYNILHSLVALRVWLSNILMQYILQRADLIVVLSQLMSEKLVEKGIPESKIMVLPLGANIKLFSLHKNGENVRYKYGLDDSAVLIYSGTMAEIRQLDVLIYALVQVRQVKRGVKLLMVGNGNQVHLKRLVATLKLENEVIFTGQIPYSEIPQYIAAADIGLCSIPPLEIYKVSSPNKLFEYMAMAKPVIANEGIPEQEKVIQESGGGILIPFSAKEFAKAIVELLNNPQRAAEMGRKGRGWVVQNRSYEVLARQLDERLLNFVNKDRMGIDRHEI
ncbi:glycosyltransferase family 4 protein [Chloroflexota bacterium]